jgi:hypothetical protein
MRMSRTLMITAPHLMSSLKIRNAIAPPETVKSRDTLARIQAARSPIREILGFAFIRETLILIRYHTTNVNTVG